MSTAGVNSSQAIREETQSNGADVQIDHVQLAMPRNGESEARRFYSALLGMEEVEKPEVLRSRGGCWFTRGSCSIHLGVDPDFVAARKAHPAFQVADLRGLAERLEAAGHPVAWDHLIPGVARFYSADPFGNRLEFMERSASDGS